MNSPTLEIGRYNELTILETGDHGVILDGHQAGRLLLSRRQCPPDLSPGDNLEVFIFVDSLGDAVPTTRRPAAQVGEVAWLEIVEVNEIGAFADWGMSKDLFIPFAEQPHKLSKGRHALVRVYIDNKGRLAGSNRIDHWIEDETEGFKTGQAVRLMIADKTEMGFKAIINHQYWGLLYANELYQRVRKGQTVDGYIKRVRDDSRVDLTLSQPGFSKGKMAGISEQILAALEDNDGFLPLNDKSPPKEIYATFKVSKKVFKQAVGGLYKQRKIVLENGGIRLSD
ncbi:GntR family transcriptional regulator [Halioglobus maricola]|uniref:GntR family transcriptional regulator n=1 Tax=Halioglobus maricola TaxID=2601894 RepID=A0A5P9NKS0_9GAMM|nr:S1-like domain-containing RNA-binding protein [Halioglobus maricola]QFU76332.1 GntR family transcriptional regulator [Halioglobus maricola]